MNPLEQFFARYLATLRALQLWFHGAHHAVHGPSFLADHEFLGELYAHFDEAYDGIAERSVLILGAPGIDPITVVPAALTQLQAWPKVSAADTDLMGTALQLVQAHLDQVESGVVALREAGVSYLELETFLGDLLVTSKKAKYKLTQRTR